jgi:hypothetical protein
VKWIVVVVILVGTAHAQPSSPGPLGKSHESFACVDCHPSNTPVVACTGCHDAMLQRGLHAQPSIRPKTCIACHDEHKGSKHDIQGWRSVPGGMARFDHTLTGWPLRGQHAMHACVRCHTGAMASGRTRFTGLPTTCGASGCHQANPHRFAGPEFLRCDRCHTEAAWKPVKAAMDFDHDRDTKMPLVGAHRTPAFAATLATSSRSRRQSARPAIRRRRTEARCSRSERARCVIHRR